MVVTLNEGMFPWHFIKQPKMFLNSIEGQVFCTESHADLIHGTKSLIISKVTYW